MKLGVIAQTVSEALALRLGKVPTPLAEGVFAVMLSRALMAGVRLGVFAALEDGSLTMEELAARVGGAPEGIEALVTALTASGYLVREGGRIGNSSITARWLAPSSPRYLGNLLLFNYDHWEWWSGLEDRLLHSEPVDIHRGGRTEPEVRRYVLAMRDLARLAAAEVVGAIPLPRDATRLLDVGGSHGAYSIAMCRSHPHLTATVFDLESVARVAEPLVAAEGLGDRIAYRSGDALEDDLGGGFDAVLLFQLLHHFPPHEAVRLVERASRCLRPGGIAALLEPSHDPPRPDQLAGLLRLHYFLTSRGRVHPGHEIEGWLGAAGLRHVRVRQLRSAPGLELTTAKMATKR